MEETLNQQTVLLLLFRVTIDIESALGLIVTPLPKLQQPFVAQSELTANQKSAKCHIPSIQQNEKCF